MQDSMIFYKSFYQAINKLDTETQAEVYNAIFSYALDDKEPDNLSKMANVVFTLIKPQIDANNLRRENGKKGAEFGKKGGRPKKENPIGVINKNPIGDIKKNPLGLQTKTPNVNVNVNDNVNNKQNYDFAALKKMVEE